MKERRAESKLRSSPRGKFRQLRSGKVPFRLSFDLLLSMPLGVMGRELLPTF
jgi:hypothetical protein